MIEKTTDTGHKIESSRLGLKLFLQNKSRLARKKTPVLFVHGATYPSSVTFDYPIDNLSWLDWMAKKGFDVWSIDLLGYGKSDRPREMLSDPDLHPPLVDTKEAVLDVKHAIKYITQYRKTSEIDLVGYSWGTAICAQISTEMPDSIRRLTLSGALWVISTQPPIGTNSTVGAYRTVDKETIKKRWLSNLSDTQKGIVADPKDIDRWIQAAIKSDPESTQSGTGKLRAPSGVIKDLDRYWYKGIPTYSPEKIRCPVQIVVGEWDQETTPNQGMEIFQHLKNAQCRRITIIGAATHSMLLEKQRFQLYEVVGEFLAAPNL